MEEGSAASSGDVLTRCRPETDPHGWRQEATGSCRLVGSETQKDDKVLEMDGGGSSNINNNVNVFNAIELYT